MTTLARKLRVVDYFALGWGTMVGVGWLVVMDDWLLRGGSLGAILGFAIGGALLLPIGFVYGRLVAAIPDASAEIAYTAKVFPQPVSFATGWMMVLAYFIVCPGRQSRSAESPATSFPALDSMEMYRIAGRPVYLPHLVIGLGLTAFLTAMNYRGIRLSATFQNWTTLRDAGAVSGVCWFRGQPGLAGQLPASVYPRRICLGTAGDPDCALFHDGFRIGGEGSGGSQTGFSLAAVFHGDLDGDRGRDPVLYRHHRRGRICCTLAPTHW